jgi:hypothetical protein
MTDFWAAIRKSAALVRDQPVYTQAGLVLSDNFDGPRPQRQLDALKARAGPSDTLSDARVRTP